MSICQRIRRVAYSFARQGNFVVPSGTLHCVSTSFATRQLHFVSASIMKLSYSQMKLSAEADKRSCVLADTNEKSKSCDLDFWQYIAFSNHPYVTTTAEDFSTAVASIISCCLSFKCYRLCFTLSKCYILLFTT